jgi:hypothetical protein
VGPSGGPPLRLPRRVRLSAWIRILDGPEGLCQSLLDLYGIPALSCAFQHTVRWRLASFLPETAAVTRLAAAAMTCHARRDPMVPMGLVNREGRWRPSLGMRSERCERCRRGVETSRLSSRLEHYRSVDHVASMYRIPAVALEAALQVIEEIDEASCTAPS